MRVPQWDAVLLIFDEVDAGMAERFHFNASGVVDQETARVYLESRLWLNGPTCSVCGSAGRITTRKGGYYRCNAFKLDFTREREPSSNGRMFR